MSLQIKDGISPGLKSAAAKIADKKPLHEAMGLTIVSRTKRAFTDESLRPAPWAARNPPTGTWSLLRKSGALWQSIRITEVTNDHVTVGSDRKYAAVHQFGSSKKSGRGSGIPARPFFPFTKEKKLTPEATTAVERVLKAKISAILKP